MIYGAAATGGLLAVIGVARPASLSGFDPAAERATRQLMGLVLYLGVVVAAPVQHALAVVAAGPAPGGVRSRAHLVLNLAAMLGALILFPAAIVWQALWFLVAVPSGFTIGLRNMAYANRRAATPLDWQREHLTSTVTAGIVLHTTVLVIAAARWPALVPAGWTWAPWLVPALVGLPVIVRLRRG